MKWFLALNRHSTGFEQYADLARVAVRTARDHTGLVPHLLYDGPNEPLLEELTAVGVNVIRRRSFLYDQLREIAERTNNPNCLTIGAGTFLRLELPALAAERRWTDTQVFYTDVDVLFTADPVPTLRTIAPNYFAATREDRANRFSINAGVMLMNLPALRSEDAAFREYVTRHLEHFTRHAWDQDAYRTYYTAPFNGDPAVEVQGWKRWLRRRRWTELPLELNWRPYWGANSAAKIIHFHGPKPQQAPFFRMPQKARPPELKPLAPLASPEYLRACELWQAALDQTMKTGYDQTSHDPALK